MLTCDRSAKRHYGDEHGRYWSVSQVCDVVVGTNGHATLSAKERGTDIHLIFALSIGHSVGWCEAPDVPTDYAGYHRGILRFIEERKPQPDKIELSQKHSTLPLAGTVDFLGWLDGIYGVLDLKTGGERCTKSRRTELQLASYDKIFNVKGKRWVLYLTENGAFDVIALKPNPRDWAVMMNGLSILQWREG